MLIFINFNSAGGARWYVGPLLFLLPTLLQSGYLTQLVSAPAAILAWLFSGVSACSTVVRCATDSALHVMVVLQAELKAGV